MANEHHDYIESDPSEYGDTRPEASIQPVSEMDLTDPDFDEMPEEIRSLVGSCEIGEKNFSNDDMSVALKFGELIWRRLTRMAEHYENMADQYGTGSLRSDMLLQAAKDMRLVLSDCQKDL